MIIGVDFLQGWPYQLRRRGRKKSKKKRTEHSSSSEKYDKSSNRRNIHQIIKKIAEKKLQKGFVALTNQVCVPSG